MINIAVVGLGFMGVTHLKGWTNVPDAQVTTVVDADPKRRAGDLTSVGGNLSGGGEGDIGLVFSNLKGYSTLAEALSDPAIDVVDICLPTDQHASAVKAALRAGKHVLCEKPLALDSATAGNLCREAEKAGRTLMTAHVLRFFPAYQELARQITGEKVRSALFRRRCAAPVWSPWLSDPARSGGAVLDLIIHDVDFCISLWGMPESVRARGHRDVERGIDVIHADLIYPRMGPVIISGGWHHPKSYPFSMEFTVTTDAATCEWASTGGDFRRYGLDGELRTIALADRDAFTAELEYFCNCIKSGQQPDRCPPAQSAQAIALVERMLESRENQ